jgi:hypothetical protein
MSKVAITGNASGTGTFTIASPDSNSDRTLTLPDGSGALYNQSNILGTVSESSGVPTGAIIESGSNANGEFVKYADGTMVCTRRVNQSVTLAAGGNYAFDFPSAFSSVPTTLVVGGSAGDTFTVSNQRVHGLPDSLPSSTSAWAFTVYRMDTGERRANQTENVRCQLLAIGRWY